MTDAKQMAARKPPPSTKGQIMSDLIDLAERLEFHADCSDMGRKPDPSSSIRRAAKALRKAANDIEALKAKLAERDAMIIKLGKNAAVAAKEYAAKLAVAQEALHDARLQLSYMDERSPS